jgi:hypothetical protein
MSETLNPTIDSEPIEPNEESESPSLYPSKKDALQIIDSVVKGGKNPKPLIDRLVAKKKEFLMRETKYLTTVIFDGMEYIYPSKNQDGFNPRMLWLFSVVQSEGKKFLDRNQDWSMPTKLPVNITNYDYDDSFGQLTGTDINSAYWTIAHKMGVISDTTYTKAQDPKYKRVRLAALAILGRNISYTKFKDGVKQTKPFIYENQEKRLKQLYQAIRYSCYQTMNELAKLLGDDFEAYRTDCIYYRDTPDNRKIVHEYLTKHGFEFKQLVYDEPDTKNENAEVVDNME